MRSSCRSSATRREPWPTSRSAVGNVQSCSPSFTDTDVSPRCSAASARSAAARIQLLPPCGRRASASSARCADSRYWPSHRWASACNRRISPSSGPPRGAFGPLDRRGVVGAEQRVARRAGPVLGRLLAVLRALPVLGQDALVGLAERGEPLGGEAVPERAVGFGERGVRGLADERVAEGVFGLAREPRVAPRGEELALDEALQPSGDLAGVLDAAEQGHEPRAPGGAAEHARRAQDPPVFAVQGVEPGGGHGEHGLGEGLFAAFRDRPDELLEVERVARRTVDEPRHQRVGGHAVAEGLAHEALGRPARQLREAHLLQVPLRPQAGEGLVELGARDAEYAERLVLQLAQRHVEQRHRGRIAPVQIFQDHEHRVHAALRAEPVLPGALEVVAEERRIVARRLEFERRGARARGAHELAEVGRHALEVRDVDAAREALAQRVPTDLGGIARADAGRAPHDLGRDPVGRPGRHRVGARDPDLGVDQRPDELVAHARLAHTRGPHEQDRLAQAFFGGARAQPLERGDLGAAAHARELPAEQRARLRGGGAFAEELEHGALAAHLEPHVEERRRDLVEPHAPGPRARGLAPQARVHERHGAIDRLAHRQAPDPLRPARRHRHRARPVPREREREPGRPRRLVGGRRLDLQRRHDHPVREPLEAGAVARGELFEGDRRLAREPDRLRVGQRSRQRGRRGDHDGDEAHLARAERGQARGGRWAGDLRRTRDRSRARTRGRRAGGRPGTSRARAGADRRARGSARGGARGPGCGSSNRIFASTAVGFAPWNGRCPVMQW